MNKKANILILDDEKRIVEEISEFLLDYDYTVFTASLPSEALDILLNNQINIAIVDIRMPEMNGLTFLEKIKIEYPNTEVIMISGHGDMDSVVTALRNGASDFFQKPFRLPNILAAIQRTIKYHTLNAEYTQLKSKYSLLTSELQNKMGFEIIGKSKAMQNVVQLMKKVANTDHTAVLITGESGTGKELIAKGIHHMSKRKDNIFYSVNCSAIPETLFESEFFGHLKGSFTGANDSREGWFEIADGGSLFLDEIGDMPLTQQSKLLRIIEEKKVSRVGSRKTSTFNVRIITASNRSLTEMIRQNTFRLDLFHRISTFIIEIPPLRDRKEDIPMLVDYFIGKLKKQVNSKIKKVEDKVYDILTEYHYPGNIRELRNIIERALILADGTTLKAKDFHINEHVAFVKESTANTSFPKKDTPKKDKEYIQEVLPLKKLEYITIINALVTAGYKKSKAAKLLGVSYQILLRKLKMQVPDYLKENYSDADFIETEYNRLNNLYHIEKRKEFNLKAVEEKAIRDAMRVTKNRRDQAAELLEISYQSISRKLQNIKL